MSTWTKRGETIDGAWANKRLWRRRRHWRRATEAEALASRALEQAEIRRTFLAAP
jgi:hypothetical protein